MVGFYCATPYHILSAIHLATTKYENQKINIVLMNHFIDAEKIVCKLKETELFENIYLLNQSRCNTFGKKIKRIIDFIFPSRVIKNFTKFDYSEVLFFAIDFMNSAYIIKKLMKKNKNVVFSYAEDGLGTYVAKVFEPPKIIRFFLRLTNRKKQLENVKNLYVYRPDLMLENKSFSIEKIPPIVINDESFRKYINMLWNTSEAINLDKREIYFEQPIEEDIKINTDEIEIEILKILKQNIGYEDLIIKMHPRSSKKLKEFKTYLSCSPFEFLLMNLDTNNKILITPMSTACFTPKIIVNQEPIVILTYKLFPEYKKKYSLICEKIEKFAKKIDESYSSKGRIYIPKNLKEFNEIITDISERRSDAKYYKQ